MTVHQQGRMAVVGRNSWAGWEDMDWNQYDSGTVMSRRQLERKVDRTALGRNKHTVRRFELRTE